MSSPRRDRTDLNEAAVDAACQQIVQAIGPLAASPLDERAAARMRVALQRAEPAAVRRALRRLRRPGEPRPPLTAVPCRTRDSTLIGHPKRALPGQLLTACAPGGAA